MIRVTRASDRDFIKLVKLHKDLIRVVTHAVHRAMQDVYLPEAHRLMDNTSRSWGYYKHNWKRNLRDNLKIDSTIFNEDRSRVVFKIENMNRAQKNFLEGGFHFDWPFDRIVQWLKDKDGITRDALARRYARRIIRNLNKHGAKPWPLFDEIYKSKEAEFMATFEHYMQVYDPLMMGNIGRF